MENLRKLGGFTGWGVGFGRGEGAAPWFCRAPVVVRAHRPTEGRRAPRVGIKGKVLSLVTVEGGRERSERRSGGWSCVLPPWARERREQLRERTALYACTCISSLPSFGSVR